MKQFHPDQLLVVLILAAAILLSTLLRYFQNL